MIEAIVAFLAGWFLSWPALGLMLLLGIIFEANEAHSWSMFTGIVTAIVAYFFFSIPFVSLLIYSVGYFVVGFIWSFWRYKRFVDLEVNTVTKGNRQYMIEKIKPSNMLSTITTWVIVWPFSMIENIVGDLINLVQTAITKFFRGVYNRIYENAINNLIRKSE